MGLPMRQLVKLIVKDFNVQNWKENKSLYPVTIREEVSDTFEYTTYIGSDAKRVLDFFSLRLIVSKMQTSRGSSITQLRPGNLKN